MAVKCLVQWRKWTNERLKAEGIELTKKQLQLAAPIKVIGSLVAAIKLHTDVETELKFEVVSENPIEENMVSEEDINHADEWFDGIVLAS